MTSVLKYLPGLLIILLLMSGCRSVPPFQGEFEKIAVGPGPEDMALDTLFGQERLIIPCDERRTDDVSENGFYAYEIASGEVSRLTISDLPEDVSLHPHGIDLTQMNGKRVLYCVNHEKNEDDFPPAGRQSILIFELLDDRVVFRQQLISELLISPNDVCTDHRGGIYVSNDSGKRNAFLEKLFELKRSTVVHYNGSEWKFVGDRLKYANGAGVRNGRLYVTGTQEKHVFSYSIAPDGTLTDKQQIPASKGNDNITFNGTKLVTTAHLDFLKFMKHVSDSEAPSPCMAYSIDLNTNDRDTLFMDDGTTISAASTGLIYKDTLYVAQVFNPFVLRIPLHSEK